MGKNIFFGVVHYLVLSYVCHEIEKVENLWSLLTNMDDGHAAFSGKTNKIETAKWSLMLLSLFYECVCS